MLNVLKICSCSKADSSRWIQDEVRLCLNASLCLNIKKVVLVEKVLGSKNLAINY